MSNELRPYGEYKDTGYDWLTKVPKHWQVTSIRGITKLSNERNGCRNDLELLSVYREYGVIRKSSRDDNHNVESQDLSNYKIVDKGYLVLNKMKMWQGSLGVSKYKGIVSPAYIVCMLVDDLNFDYVHYLLRSPKFKTIYNRISYGVRVGQWDMRYEDFKNIKLFIPPREEQDQIVKYLDYKLAKINKFIKAKKELIAVLKEKKQAIINEAVTKGINPNVKMKPSGIEWLRDIPEHWKCKKIKRCSKINPMRGNLITKYPMDKKVVFLPMERISIYGEIDNSDMRAIKEIKDGFTYFERNDVVVAKITPCFENGKGACLDKLESEIGFGTTELIVLRPFNSILPQYLYLITRISYFRILGSDVMTGAAGQKRVPSDFIANFNIGIPDVDEQKNIINYINEKVKQIDNSVINVEKEISLITEYRTSLISDVVTGKVDVRNIKIEELKNEKIEFEETDEEMIEGEEEMDLEESGE